MRRFLLDTGIAADLIYRRLGVDERARQAKAQGYGVGISLPVLGELYAGAEGSNDPEKYLTQLGRGLDKLTQWPFDKAAARVFGRLFAHLKRAGRSMQAIDLQTAAIALSLGKTTVVTKDSDFLAIPGLSVENWAEAS